MGGVPSHNDFLRQSDRLWGAGAVRSMRLVVLAVLSCLLLAEVIAGKGRGGGGRSSPGSSGGWFSWGRKKGSSSSGGDPYPKQKWEQGQGNRPPPYNPGHHTRLRYSSPSFYYPSLSRKYGGMASLSYPELEDFGQYPSPDWFENPVGGFGQDSFLMGGHSNIGGVAELPEASRLPPVNEFASKIQKMLANVRNLCNRGSPSEPCYSSNQSLADLLKSK